MPRVAARPAMLLNEPLMGTPSHTQIKNTVLEREQPVRCYSVSKNGVLECLPMLTYRYCLSNSLEITRC